MFSGMVWRFFINIDRQVFNPWSSTVSLKWIFKKIYMRCGICDVSKLYTDLGWRNSTIGVGQTLRNNLAVQRRIAMAASSKTVSMMPSVWYYQKELHDSKFSSGLGEIIPDRFYQFKPALRFICMLYGAQGVVFGNSDMLGSAESIKDLTRS